MMIKYMMWRVNTYSTSHPHLKVFCYLFAAYFGFLTLKNVLICCDRSGLISLISLHSNNAFIKLVGQQSVEDCRQFLFSVK